LGTPLLIANLDFLGAGRSSRDHRDRGPARRACRPGGDELLKAALLVSFSWAEERISPYTQGYEPFVARYVEILASLGYTPDPYEAEQIAYARHAAEEAAAIQDAEQDDRQHDDDQEAAEPGEVEA
jgi:hypothetical protein